jgi:plasmid stabilization system protein ParE
MAFQVEITPIAEVQIEQAYQWYRVRDADFADRWFRALMNAIATLQEKPRRCAMATEQEIFPEEVRQLLHGKSRSMYRVLFTIRENTVFILYVRHSAQPLLTPDDLQENDG